MYKNIYEKDALAYAFQFASCRPGWLLVDVAPRCGASTQSAGQGTISEMLARFIDRAASRMLRALSGLPAPRQLRPARELNLQVRDSRFAQEFGCAGPASAAGTHGQEAQRVNATAS